MVDDLLYDEKMWILILIVLIIISIGIRFAIIAVIAWLIFLWWNRFKFRIPPSDK